MVDECCNANHNFEQFKTRVRAERFPGSIEPSAAQCEIYRVMFTINEYPDAAAIECLDTNCSEGCQPHFDDDLGQSVPVFAASRLLSSETVELSNVIPAPVGRPDIRCLSNEGNSTRVHLRGSLYSDVPSSIVRWRCTLSIQRESDGAVACIYSNRSFTDADNYGNEPTLLIDAAIPLGGLPDCTEFSDGLDTGVSICFSDADWTEGSTRSGQRYQRAEEFPLWPRAAHLCVSAFQYCSDGIELDQDALQLALSQAALDWKVQPSALC